MDYIFDRLGNLLKSYLNDSGRNRESGYGIPSGNPDYDDAMAELDEMLGNASSKSYRDDSSTHGSERNYSKPTGSARSQADPPESLRADYFNLEVPFGSPLPVVKKNYKLLLKICHPDRHSGDPEAVREATVKSARINASFQRIETWVETGKID